MTSGRGRWGLAGLAGLALVSAAAVPAPAADEFVAGTGSAYAAVIQAGPKAGGLAFTVTLGEALAGYVSTAAQAESQRVDLGILGVLISAKQCDESQIVRPDQIPQPTRVDSREQGASAGKHNNWAGTSAGSPVVASLGDEQASATANPLGHAVTTMALASLPGVVDVLGARSEVRSGISEGRTRMSEAVVDISQVDLLGGIVRLHNLHWRARQHTGSDDTHDGTFALGSVEVAGQPLPLGDPSAALAAVNTLTSQVGVTLVPPQFSEVNGVVKVTPLLVHLAASPTQQSITSPLLSALQPARQAVTAALIATDCRWATVISIADVSAGPTTGAGAFELGLGGASATTEGTRYGNPFASLPPVGANLLRPPGEPGPAVLGIGATAPGMALQQSAPASPRPAVRRGTSPGILAGARSIAGNTGGRAALVGALALAGVLAVAGADWRRMRRQATAGDD